MGRLLPFVMLTLTIPNASGFHLYPTKPIKRPSTNEGKMKKYPVAVKIGRDEIERIQGRGGGSPIHIQTNAMAICADDGRSAICSRSHPDLVQVLYENCWRQ